VPQMMKREVETILAALSTIRVTLVNEEYDLHALIGGRLIAAGISFQTEYYLGPRNRIDFFLPGGIGIEAKKGKPAKAQVVAQLTRYAGFPIIQELILVVERNLDIPRELNGKPCHCFPLNRLWGVALP